MFSKSAIIFGSFILMALSLACSAWVFYELFNGGPSGLAAALAGCTLQFVAYGLSANMASTNRKTFLAFCFTGFIFSLSIALSYITISSLLEVNSNSLKEEKFNSELTQKIIDQKVQAGQLSLDAAKQGIPERYREQGKKFIEQGDSLSDEALNILNNFTQGRPAALPTYSAWQWFDSHPHLMGMLAIAMALLFDLTPVYAFFYLSSGRKETETKKTSAVTVEFSVDQSDCDREVKEAISLFTTRNLEPKYRDVCQHFKVGNVKAKAILEAAADVGVLIRNGSAYELNNRFMEAAA